MLMKRNGTDEVLMSAQEIFPLISQSEIQLYDKICPYFTFSLGCFRSLGHLSSGVYQLFNG